MIKNSTWCWKGRRGGGYRGGRFRGGKEKEEGGGNFYRILTFSKPFIYIYFNGGVIYNFKKCVYKSTLRT